MHRANDKSGFDVWLKPVRLNYWKMDWKKAHAFHQEFKANIHERIAALERNVRSTEGFAEWSADYSKESFRALGPWMKRVARVDPVAPKDVRVEIYNPKLRADTIEFMRELAKRDITVVLTKETAAIAVDIGIYCGETVRRTYPSLNWGRCKARCSEDQNYPILEMRTNSGSNPLVQPYNFTMRLLEGKIDGDAFHILLTKWLLGAEKTEAYRQQRLAKRKRK